MSVAVTRLLGLWMAAILCCSIGFVATAMAKTDVAPDVTIRSPADHIATSQNSIEVIVDFRASANPTGKARPPTGNVRLIALTLNGSEVGRYDNPPHVKTGSHTFAIDLSSYPDSILTLQAFAYQGNPKAGHVGTSSPVPFIVDRTPPIITAELAPTPNPNNWSNADVTVSFTATDNLSGVARVEPSKPVVIITEKAGQKVKGTATDKAGNTASTTVTVNLDKTAPGVDIVTPADGAITSATTVTVSGSASDSLSGVANIICNGKTATGFNASYTCDVPLNEGPNLIKVQVTDLAGHVSTASISVTRDTTPPIITITTPDNDSLFNTSPGAVTGTVQDATATSVIVNGIAASVSDGAFTATNVPLAEGSNTLTATATDAAGNSSTAVVTVVFDGTPPDVAITSPADGAFFNVPVVALTGTVSDDLSGVVGVTCHDTAATVAGSSFTCDVPLVEGANVIEAVATDNAGNIRTASIAVTLDTVPPMITAMATPSANAAGWHNTPVIVSFDCTDSGSGIATCPDTVPVETEGADQAVEGTATDRAGNSASVNAVISLDTTAPGVSLTSPPDGATLNTPGVDAAGTASDALSGIADVSCNGGAASLSTSTFTCNLSLEEGANSITAEATDKAGNVGTARIAVTRQTLPVVTITAPTNLSYVNISPTTVTGTVDDPTAAVTVNAIPAAVVNGSFSMAVPLAEGPNLVTASAIATAGVVGSHSIQVTLDTTPPHVTITSPPDSFVTTDSTITVAGIVNDIVVGTVNDQQAQVSVNSIPAQVANRTFLATDVPLVLGDNIIQAVVSDRVGNAATTQITVTRQAPSQQAQIQLIAGNNQTGMIGSLLPAPLVVALTDATGNPTANQPVIFKVIQNNGMVAAGGPAAPTVIATTDAQGQAQVQWTLGSRAGAGANTSEAYAVGFEGTAMFTATGTQSPATKIVVDSGNEQIGAVNQPLPRPLIAVVVDSGNNRLAGIPVTFSVAKGDGSVTSQAAASAPLIFTVNQGDGSVTDETSVTVVTDADGRAAATWMLGPQAGNANNRLQANFPSNLGHPASFTASGRVSGDPVQTTISGVVLDNSDVPIPGVTVRAVLANVLNANVSALQTVDAVQTDAQGQFLISQAPVGFVKLLVDGSTAQRSGEYPSLEYDLVTVSGQDNTVGMPVYLLPLNPNNQLCVTATTGGGTLTMPEAPGFSLTFGPGQVTFPGGSQTGCVSVTVVHGDKVPMVPGFGQQPRFIVTIQPTGAIFNPPAPITLPNVDGLQPREMTEMYSFDHDIGSFVAIGTGTVSDDGLLIQSDPGVGVLKAGWHCGGNPTTTGTTATCATCETCEVDRCRRIADCNEPCDDPRYGSNCPSCFKCIDGNRCEQELRPPLCIPPPDDGCGGCGTCLKCEDDTCVAEEICEEDTNCLPCDSCEVCREGICVPDLRCTLDDDGDGVPNGEDSDPNAPNKCGDDDNDTCDDCISGRNDPANDGSDFDLDGLCDAGDPDIDNDGIPNNEDICPQDPDNRCSEDIAITSPLPGSTVCAADQITVRGTVFGASDVEVNGSLATITPSLPIPTWSATIELPDIPGSLGLATITAVGLLIGQEVARDTVIITLHGSFTGCDFDKDGVIDTKDSEPDNPNVCIDSEETASGDLGDGCDDCSKGKFDPSNDGPDSDGDTFCDLSFANFFGDNCNLTPNPDQRDDNRDGIGDACQFCKGVEGQIYQQEFKDALNGAQRELQDTIAAYNADILVALPSHASAVLGIAAVFGETAICTYLELTLPGSAPVIKTVCNGRTVWSEIELLLGFYEPATDKVAQEALAVLTVTQSRLLNSVFPYLDNAQTAQSQLEKLKCEPDGGFEVLDQLINQINDFNLHLQQIRDAILMR